MLLTKAFEVAVGRAADLAWRVCIRAGRSRRAGSFQPPWASRPLLRSWEKTSPELGWPRTTDSLCPVCVKEARARILSGENDADILRTSHVGEIKATVLERDGFIRADWRPSENNRRAKYYTLTATGRRQLAIESQAWDRMSHAIGRVMRLA